MIYRSLIICSLLLSFFSLQSQLVVQPLNGPGNLASLLAGVGLSISNVQINCDSQAIGTFLGASSNIGLSGGLMLSTGTIHNLPGPNNQVGTSSYLMQPGDGDLSTLTGGSTFDACVLEFDCIPVGDTLLFNFVFGSEEYPEYVNSGINDGFAIWITGPGYPTLTNIAYLTGTTTPVTVNDVNNVQNPSFYIDNGDGSTAPQNVDTTVVQLDGFTVNLTSQVPVLAGGNYHFKIGVADAMDGVYDTAVFLSAGSFRTAGGAVSMQSGALSKVRVFPNPSQGVFQIVPGQITGDVEWTVFDLRGKLVRKGTEMGLGRAEQGFRIEMDGAAPGMYHLLLRNGNAVSSCALVIE